MKLIEKLISSSASEIIVLYINIFNSKKDSELCICVPSIYCILPVSHTKDLGIPNNIQDTYSAILLLYCINYGNTEKDLHYRMTVQYCTYPNNPDCPHTSLTQPLFH